MALLCLRVNHVFLPNAVAILEEKVLDIRHEVLVVGRVCDIENAACVFQCCLRTENFIEFAVCDGVETQARHAVTVARHLQARVLMDVRDGS